ncbi:Nucleotide-binding universal stress protein, UspA family [Collimonas sp. OK242]|uniref:universal stress protein n=1 Tax=Collimonas sp. OK242 TaxID=1798195 RepID=UPI0008997898|nr:universal stress protein [Collimonas sp. OK242]SDX59753.1 Nucleotide-binding universal stress protein, UspA family [Collimonas sp. OK242]
MSLYKNILLGLDGSPTSGRALMEVASFSAPGSTIRIVHVIEDLLTNYPSIDGDFSSVESLREAILADSKKMLFKAETDLRSQGFEVQTSLLELRDLGGDVAGAIKAEGDKHDIDLTVLGTHGRGGVRRLMLGSVAEHFVRISERPVLLVHFEPPQIQIHNRVSGLSQEEDHIAVKRILVAIDGSELANSALRQAIVLAKEKSCEIRALYVSADPFLDLLMLSAKYFHHDQILKATAKQTANIRQAATHIFNAAGVPCDMQIIELNERGTRIADTIKNAAAQWGAGLVVMGSHGLHGALRFALGSVAEQYLRISDRPVLIVKS